MAVEITHINIQLLQDKLYRPNMSVIYCQSIRNKSLKNPKVSEKNVCIASLLTNE